jgi:predicted GH43/DUF377 family glycosyl hydrolase
MAKLSTVGMLFVAILFCAPWVKGQAAPPAPGGWVKYEHNPIITDANGIYFDILVRHDDGIYRMWVSWRPKNCIALLESKDGIHWDNSPQVVLSPVPTGWEDVIYRPTIVKREDGYHMWYNGQTKDHSAIGYATSPDGVHWKRMSDQPVLKADVPWEKAALVCPYVLWDEKTKLYRMWYSGGPQMESDAMGYATSPDGLHWTKSEKNPIFNGDPNLSWEKERGVGGQVIQQGDWYYMFYIGFHDMGNSQVGVARSRDGITGWERLPQNPIIPLGPKDAWDSSSIYKPYVLLEGNKWTLFYHARMNAREQIGFATHDGLDLGFPAMP